jgi:2'-5' RNA ligase
MAEAYAPLLKRPEFYETIPTEWLHATILRVGTVEDYSDVEMLAVADIVQQKLATTHLQEFHFGQHVLIHGNVCFKIEPEAELEKLYTVVTESLEAVVGSGRATKSPYGHFIAHTSLVYTKSQNNEAEIDKILSEANIAPAKFEINSMPLIKQRPTNGHYEWEVVKDIIIS